MTMTEESGGVRCENGGECLDGIGDSFSCLCQPGWAGELCEVDIDECQADPPPCLNEGHCIDMLGDFYCVCPLTWTGRHCEEEVAQCQSSPCLNEALCLVEDNSYRCYCVPDYHGPICQWRYDECQLPPGPKCLHGGLCVDDVDGFQCQCQPGFSGEHCHCSSGSLETNTSMETNLTCLDISTSLSWTIPPSYQEEDQDEDLSSSVYVAEVSVTVDWVDVTAITADILTSPTIGSPSSTSFFEPDLGVDIDLEEEMVNSTLLAGTEGISDPSGCQLQDLFFSSVRS